MEYGATVSHKPILLANGFYKSIEYFILTLGSHPTAYVKIPHGNKYWGSNGDEILTHCGITYTSTVLYYYFFEQYPYYRLKFFHNYFFEILKIFQYLLY